MHFIQIMHLLIRILYSLKTSQDTGLTAGVAFQQGMLTPLR